MVFFAEGKCPIGFIHVESASTCIAVSNDPASSGSTEKEAVSACSNQGVEAIIKKGSTWCDTIFQESVMVRIMYCL